jgi:hypothetical protein
MQKILLLISIFCSVLFFSCKKDNEIAASANAKLSFSKDTVIFDTVFTSVGSSTYQLKVYNNENFPINISTIRLAKGDNSPYRINVDGNSGSKHHNVEIASMDSIFIFVEVTIDPNNSNNPFIVQDSILFEQN